MRATKKRQESETQEKKKMGTYLHKKRRDSRALEQSKVGRSIESEEYNLWEQTNSIFPARE